MGVYGVLDRQFVQAEHVGTACIWCSSGSCSPIQTNALLALAFEFADVVQRCGVGVLAGRTLTVDVYAAVHHRPRHGNVNGLRIRVTAVAPNDR
ncbi:MAG: hypothetical protein NVS4B6_18770 [Mycobacterium sp.]